MSLGEYFAKDKQKCQIYNLATKKLSNYSSVCVHWILSTYEYRPIYSGYINNDSWFHAKHSLKLELDSEKSLTKFATYISNTYER